MFQRKINAALLSWLSVIPLEEHGFILNKGELRDAVSLRYNNKLRGLPSKCPCGQIYNEAHALNCKKGGFVIIRHNNVRDFEANHGEQIDGLAGDNARPDIKARGEKKRQYNSRIMNIDMELSPHWFSQLTVVLVRNA